MVIMFRLVVPEKHFGMRWGVVLKEMVTAVMGKKKINTHIQIKVAVGSSHTFIFSLCHQVCRCHPLQKRQTAKVLPGSHLLSCFPALLPCQLLLSCRALLPTGVMSGAAQTWPALPFLSSPLPHHHCAELHMTEPGERAIPQHCCPREADGFLYTQSTWSTQKTMCVGMTGAKKLRRGNMHWCL